MIKTIACFALVVVTLLLVTPIGIVAALLFIIGFRKLMALVMYRIAQGWALLLIAAIGCKMTVLGRENIPRKEGVCFVSNHGSIFDIVVMLAYAGRRLGFIAKKELLLLPFFNLWIAMLGGLFLDRKNPRNAIKTIGKGVERLKAGGAMIIFPEGHRSRGQGLLPFHPGSLKLATQSGTVIIPVALAGTYDIFERDNRVRAVPVRVTFCKPINTADIPAADRKAVLCDQVYGVINKALQG